MEADFWHQRWSRDETGFHQDTHNAHLLRYWGELALAEGARVLVPLCGKSLDLIWLSERGHAVVGVELSQIAAEQFFSENGLRPEISEHGSVLRYAAANIELIVADFFELDPEAVGKIDAVYDRAALIALPETMRAEYVNHLLDLVPARAPVFLITLEYDAEQMSGPPFPVGRQEVEQLLAGRRQVACLHHEDIISENPRFRSRGLEHLYESVFRID